MTGEQKREENGRFLFDGNLERVCVCGHTLRPHSAGSNADCIFYSLTAVERDGQHGADRSNCGCGRFRQSRRKSKRSNLTL